jgi:glucose/arabinose dehydrogenase
MKLITFLLLFVNLSWAKTFVSEGQTITSENIIERKDVIWGFDFLPDGRMIFTERNGKMAILDLVSKKVSEISGLPKVNALGQGGLLDVRVHPEFKTNNLIYFTYSQPINSKATTAVGRGKLIGEKLEDIKILFSGHEPNDNDSPDGSRGVFDGEGHIFFSMGDRDNRERAQDLSYHQGKILRLNEDGSVPKDNPFVSTKNAKPEIWCLGHRSPQGLVMRPGTKELWEAEMGPRGGDELNLILAGKNYGWPLVTYGREYYGLSIGVKEKSGFENSIAHWVPSISPSALTFYSGDKFPNWKGNVFLATLSGEHLHRVVMEGNKVVKEEKIMGGEDSRFRNVRTGPDGYLYYSTDEGKIGRLK